MSSFAHRYRVGYPLNVPTSKSYAYWGEIVSTARVPTDPYFYANITLQNIVVGSRYWIAQASDLSNVVATGVAAASEVLIENVAAYANPMLVEIRVRSASGETKYQALKTYGYLVREGTTIYIAQVLDNIAS